MGGFTKIFLLSEEQMGEYRKFYDFSYEMHNSVGNNSISSYVPASQYPMYKHYYDDAPSAKTQPSSSSFSKTKKYPLKEKNN